MEGFIEMLHFFGCWFDSFEDELEEEEKDDGEDVGVCGDAADGSELQLVLVLGFEFRMWCGKCGRHLLSDEFGTRAHTAHVLIGQHTQEHASQGTTHAMHPPNIKGVIPFHPIFEFAASVAEQTREHSN